MLDMEKFQEILDGTTFLHGLVLDDQPYFNFGWSVMPLKWVAVKGYNNDWTIYVAKDDGNTFRDVESNGDKVTDPKNIQYLVPCSPDVLARYRY